MTSVERGAHGGTWGQKGVRGDRGVEGHIGIHIGSHEGRGAHKGAWGHIRAHGGAWGERAHSVRGDAERAGVQEAGFKARRHKKKGVKQGGG